MSKRMVVIEDGIARILGILGDPLPEVIYLDDGSVFSLLSVKPRYCIYVTPLSKAQPSGRFNDFHPEQV